MKRRSLARALTLSGSLLLLLLACAWIGRSLWSPSSPAPVEEPAHSEDESGVLQAVNATPPSGSPERRSASIPGPARENRPGPAMSRSEGAATPEAPAAAAGMVVGLDPETGTWGPPTREQLRELAEIRSRAEGDAHRVAKPDGWLPEVRHPDGHVSVDLNGQFQEFTTAHIGSDGKPVFTCVHGPEDAERAAKEPAPPALEER